MGRKLTKKPMKLPAKNPKEQYQALYGAKGIDRSSKMITMSTAYVEVVVFPNIASTPELNMINTRNIEPKATVSNTRNTWGSWIKK
jgi:hypothetical protein